ncbi:16S rRNA (cytosine(967)-C(5))-methyltransferase RsmB [Halalkalibacterium ligniniphilum]|uniref:16S rRNA (cytosine(967)-C(5))-methyltransferase RsmB n=1 Tax=Halalkalibacterium ligniniphilum TaxID=1134413 RepID=UPI00034BB36F|nr:16S rRNA (cytosine(967)-C(5))-methyltransferase RsmB [Halalkalibacterium ligniniphilum]
MASKNVREVALDALLQIEKNQAYSNLLLNQTVKKSGLERRDVALLTEIVYGTVQRRDTLDFYLTPFIKQGLKKLDTWVKVLLRLSVYQLIYLDRVPDRAIFHEAVNIAKKRGHKGISGLVNGVLRSIQREGIPDLKDVKDSVERLAISTSHPRWLVERWISQYGEETTKAMCEESLIPPRVTVRVNRLKGTVENIAQQLEAEGLSVAKGALSEDALMIERGNVVQSNAFQEGLITIQDESSMLVARAVNPAPGMAVLDACAAPGGKTTHIAERMGDNGLVISLDLHEHKVKLIQEQVDRLQLTNVEAHSMDARKAQEKWEPETFDRILVDAPCTGFGVIRRKPDIKWTKTEKDIAAIHKIQTDILEAVAPLLKQGGTLIYSTCTIDKEENEQTVRSFLNQHPSFLVDPTLFDRLPSKVKEKGRGQEGMVTILPHDFGTDGFFIASMVKQKGSDRSGTA